jgi:hypothetical protein
MIEKGVIDRIYYILKDKARVYAMRGPAGWELQRFYFLRKYRYTFSGFTSVSNNIENASAAYFLL